VNSRLVASWSHQTAIEIGCFSETKRVCRKFPCGQGAHCRREFKALLSLLKRTSDTQKSLWKQFAKNKCPVHNLVP
jgi:hypothetical protein